MEIPVLISVAGTQRFAGMESETIELVTNGTYRYEPGLATISYVETEMTGLEGVVTSFTVEDGKKVTLRRTGKVNSTMVFVLGQKDESLYDCGAGALMIGVCATQMTVLLNERGGVLNLNTPSSLSAPSARPTSVTSRSGPQPRLSSNKKQIRRSRLLRI